ncbi:MAG: GTP-binding protein [Promethearchaeota archaeon]|nr:GTP-binding protein [Candidatus Lokiarchaeota archaeon]TET57622.1 MAG: GTP-binding protein [Candidatus Lokiarchaeota archaeon]
MKKIKFTLKIIIVGEPAVGKTSLVKKFVSGQFSKDYRSSIGTNIFIKKINLENIGETTIQLWDIAGQERWINMRRSYYSGAKGVLIVGDLTRKNTFDQIVKFWVPDVKQYCELTPIVLIANKNDLKEEINEIEINTLGQQINAIGIFTTSAKTGENVEMAFKIISEHAIKEYY